MTTSLPEDGLTTRAAHPDSDAEHLHAQLAPVVDEIGAYLTDRMLDARVRHLPAREGSAQRPEIAYVSNLRYDMSPEKMRARPWYMLLWVALVDVADGVPADAVAEPFKQAVKFIEQYAAEIRDAKKAGAIAAPSLLAPMLAETRAEYALNIAQIAAQESPNDPEILQRMLDRTTDYRVKLTALEDATRERIAALEKAA